jgi:hypothetical protein
MQPLQLALQTMTGLIGRDQQIEASLSFANLFYEPYLLPDNQLREIHASATTAICLDSSI